MKWFIIYLIIFKIRFQKVLRKFGKRWTMREREREILVGVKINHFFNAKMNVCVKNSPWCILVCSQSRFQFFTSYFIFSQQKLFHFFTTRQMRNVIFFTSSYRFKWNNWFIITQNLWFWVFWRVIIYLQAVIPLFFVVK